MHTPFPGAPICNRLFPPSVQRETTERPSSRTPLTLNHLCLALPLLLAIGSPLLAQTCSPIPSGCVAWWQGNGNANDAQGTNNGVLRNGAAVTNAGMVGQAFKLDGADDYVEFAGATSLPISTAITIETWIKPDRTNDTGTIVCNKQVYDGTWYLGTSPGGELRVAVGGPFSGGYWAYTTNAVIPVGQWSHVALTFDTQTQVLRMFANGAELGVAFYPSQGNVSSLVSQTPVRIGTIYTSQFTEFFAGLVDELALYNRALSPTEIQAIYAIGSNGKCPNTSPGIFAQPTSRFVLSGSSALFTVGAAGLPPFSYQWFFNTTNSIPGQTNVTLLLPNVTLAQAGSYSVRITNSLGTVLSSNATLLVWDSSDTTSIPPGDRLTYFQKLSLSLNPLTPDTDGDGLTDYDELFVYGTNPLLADTDGDGMPDGWEVANGLNPRVNDASADLDLDGLTNLQEYQNRALGYWANQADSLSDGRSDSERLFGSQTNRFYYDRNDRLIGADYNRGSNGFAIAYVYDGNGNLLRQKSLVRDTNHNGLPDVWEFLSGLTNNASAYADTDGDGWTDFQEWKAGTDPRDATSKPGLLGNPGLNITSLALPFTPSNFVVGVGQLDGLGAEEIVIGADGNPGTNSNFLLVLTQGPTTWSTQRVDVGPFGVTSIAVGQLASRPGPAIYAGLRQPGGAGHILELLSIAGVWESKVVASSTNEAAFVLGVRYKDLLATYSPSNGMRDALYSLSWSSNRWLEWLTDTNGSHRGLGTMTQTENDKTVALRLLDMGGIQLGSVGGLPTNAVLRQENATWYFTTPAVMTWPEAQAYAAEWQGCLVTINSMEDNAWLRARFASSFWLGLYRDDCSTPWKWISGSPVTFTRWNPGQPDCSGGVERFTHMWGNPMDTWNDLPGSGLLLGIVEVKAGGGMLLPELGADKRLLSKNANAAGSRVRSKLPYVMSQNGATNYSSSSVITAFVDDANSNGIVDEGDRFCVYEYWLHDTNASVLTLSRTRNVSSVPAQSYGLASVNFLNASNEVFFTGEPDGQVIAWTATGSTNPLQRQLFSAHHAGKAWHALAAVKTLEPGEGLVGLRVGPAAPNTCHVILWPAQSQLPQLASIPNTAPAAAVLPQSGVAGTLVPLRIRLWDAEGNASTPFLHYQLPDTTNWQDATIALLDGAAYSPTNKVPALPTGSDHVLVWNGSTVFTNAGPTNLWFRVHAQDMMLVGEWSAPILYSLINTPDTDGDGLPDDWERQYFGTLAYGPNDDRDHDGMNNLAEYLAGTNPNDSNSKLALALRITGTNAILTWQSGSNATLYLQRLRLLDPGSAWLDILTNPAPTPTSGSYNDQLGTNAMQFYRIKATRP